MNEPHLLVLGLGSAGKRHARNLRTLGCRLSAFDPRADRLEEVAAERLLTRKFTTLEEALAPTDYDGYVIASPPARHVAQLQAVAGRGKWLLCEKPLGTDVHSAQTLAGANCPLLLTYTYRWWPPVQELRRRILAGQIGTPRHWRFVMSAHLADWHPWERYQDFFMASREQGGGALLDESHFVDLLLWMAGRPTRVSAFVDKLSNLEIATDDNVDLLAAYPSGARANLHLDLIGRPHQRSITVVGEEGTLHWSYEENAVKLGRTGELKWEVQSFSCERNEMFLAAAREYLELLRGERATPTCALADGLAVLEVIEAVRKSAADSAVVDLKP